MEKDKKPSTASILAMSQKLSHTNIWLTKIHETAKKKATIGEIIVAEDVLGVVVVVEGVVVVAAGVPSEGEPFPDGDGVAEGAVEALTLTESFMPPVQCPGTPHIK